MNTKLLILYVDPTKSASLAFAKDYLADCPAQLGEGVFIYVGDPAHENSTFMMKFAETQENPTWLLAEIPHLYEPYGHIPPKIRSKIDGMIRALAEKKGHRDNS